MEDKLIVLSQSQLEETINNAVSRILGEMQKTDVINKEYITREEAASLLNITLPTLHRYAKMDRIRIYKFGSRSLLKTEELILAIKENKVIKYGRRKYKRWIVQLKYTAVSLNLYCKDIFVPSQRTLRIQYLMWLYKCTSCPCIRAGFAFIAPETISSTTVIQIVIQNFFSALVRFLEIWIFSPKIARVIQTVIHIVIHYFMS